MAENDDWFASEQRPAVEREESSWDDEPRWEPDDPVQRDLGRRQAGIVLAVIVAVFLVLAGFLVGRTTTDSSTTVVTVTAAAATPETPTASTPTTTTPATTKPKTPTTPTTTPPSSAAVPTEATLRSGMKGSSVTSLQTALTTLGYSPGAADGNYGPATTEAVTAFQTANNLTADGTAGPQTLAAINAALAGG